MDTELTFTTKTNKIYRILSKKTEDLFIDTCHLVYQNSLKGIPTMCCMDLEFNVNWKNKKQYISLIQVMMIPNVKHYNENRDDLPVFLFSLENINKDSINIFVDEILCSTTTKILHGSDSMDCPHIYRDLMNQNSKKFINFLNSTIDTRFLCELTKRFRDRSCIDLLSSDVTQNKTSKCSYYHALLNNGVIDRQTFDELENESKKINYNKSWNVKILTDLQIKYAVYDVVYLYDLVINLMNSVVTTEQIDPIQTINAMFRFTMLSRLKLTKLLDVSKRLYDEQNVNPDDKIKLEQQIQETKIGSIKFIDHCFNKSCNNTPIKMDVYIEDLVSITTLKNSLLHIIRPSRLISNRTYKNSVIIKKKLDKLIKKSSKFNLLNGSVYIIELIKILTPSLHNIIKCES